MDYKIHQISEDSAIFMERSHLQRKIKATNPEKKITTMPVKQKKYIKTLYRLPCRDGGVPSRL
jgi:hypothetical protein